MLAYPNLCYISLKPARELNSSRISPEPFAGKRFSREAPAEAFLTILTKSAEILYGRVFAGSKKEDKKAMKYFAE